MTVVVDDLFTSQAYHGADVAQVRRVGSRNGHRWCHMTSTADDADYAELHRMARCIGMRPSWFQGDHYDLTPRRRDIAVSLGAIEVSGLEVAMITLYDRRGRERPEYGSTDRTGGIGAVRASSGQLALF